MMTVDIEADIRKEADKNKRKLATLDAKIAKALQAGRTKDAARLQRKITDEADRHAEKAAKLQAKLNAEANALDEDVPVEPAVRVTHGWLWGYFEPIGTAFKAREWKRAAGLVVLRLLLPAIPCIIAVNALKGCMGLNN